MPRDLKLALILFCQTMVSGNLHKLVTLDILSAVAPQLLQEISGYYNRKSAVFRKLCYLTCSYYPTDQHWFWKQGNGPILRGVSVRLKRKNLLIQYFPDWWNISRKKFSCTKIYLCFVRGKLKIFLVKGILSPRENF